MCGLEVWPALLLGSRSKDQMWVGYTSRIDDGYWALSTIPSARKDSDEYGSCLLPCESGTSSSKCVRRMLCRISGTSPCPLQWIFEMHFVYSQHGTIQVFEELDSLPVFLLSSHYPTPFQLHSLTYISERRFQPRRV